MEKYYSIFNHYLFYLLLGLLVFIPLYPKIPFLSVPGTYVSIRLEDFLVGIILAFWLLINFSKLRDYLSKTIFKSFLLFWGIGLLSVISGILITSTVLPHLGLLHFFRRVEYMSLFFVAATTIKDVNQIKLTLKVMLVATIFVALYGFGQIYLNLPVISTTNSEFSKGQILTLTPGARANSTFAGHYDLAAYLTIVLIFIGTLIFYYTGERKSNIKILEFFPQDIFKFITIGLVGLFSFALLGLTAARVSFAATLLGLMISFWLTGKRLLIVALILLSILAIGVIPELRHRLVATITVNLLEGGGPKYEAPINQVNSFTPLGDGKTTTQQELLKQVMKEASQAASKSGAISADIAQGEPINTTELGVYRSFNIRFDVEWPRAIRAFLRNPFLGSGYSSLSLATDNDILRSLGETGVLGTLALFLIFIILFKNFIKSSAELSKFEKLFLVASICSLIAILITGLFIDVLEASKISAILWIMLGIAWAVSKKYKI